MRLNITQSLLLLLGLSWFSSTAQQHEHIYLISRMDGDYVLDNGMTVDYWGFGYENSNKISLPSPLLRIQQYDTVSIHLKNLSPEAHTIHMHGLDVDQMNDGVPTTSQMIPPNDSTIYTFTAEYTGTFLYHCHVVTSLHLAMGMYGMVVVDPPNEGELFPGGPNFSQEYDYLISEMNSSWNVNSTQAFPFYDYNADVFLINGIYENIMNVASQQHINGFTEENILLRMGSVAYGTVKIHFPQELNATFYLSDGRVLNNPFDTLSVDLYPGERYSLIINAENEFTGNIEMEFMDSRTGAIIGSNYIPVDIGLSSINTQNDQQPLTLLGHPFNNEIKILSSKSYNDVSLMGINGKEHLRFNIQSGHTSIPCASLKPGIYLIRHQEIFQKVMIR